MAVLMERLVHATANPDLPSWNYRGRPYLTRTEINATEHTGTRVSRLMRHSFPHRIGDSLAADHQSSAAHPPDQHGKTPERGHNQQAHTDWER
jgi:hypothetical protein